VDANCITLTSYLAERRRANDTFVADALLDLYAERQLAMGILLRGIEGSGQRHYLRTDSSLSLADDLPVTVTAVDTRSNIEAILDETLYLNRDGLVTLEAGRLLQDEINPGSPQFEQSINTLQKELSLISTAARADEAVKLTVYCSRQDRVYGVPAFESICELLHRREIENGVALLGVDGTARGHRQRPQFFGRGEDVPMMIVAVGTADLISSVLPDLGGQLRHPLVTLERLRVCKHNGRLISRPRVDPVEHKSDLPLWQKLTVYTPESSHHGHPVHRAIVRRLRTAETSGATVHRGLWGFYGDQTPQGDRFLQWGHHVPIITTVIDTAENISAAFDIIDELTGDQGLVTSEDILVNRKAAVLP
jgi:PII-like signaling protein